MSREPESESEADDLPDRPSKTQRKKQMHELQSLGEELVELNAERLAQVEMPEDLRDAVREAQRIRSHEGKRSQMQYIGRLMRDVDPAPIRERLAAWRGQSRAHNAYEHELTRWRERLIDEEGAFAEFAALHPRVDLQHLRQLARNARHERDASKPPRSFRELFRALREALPEPGATPPTEEA